MPTANGEPSMMDAILAGEQVHMTVGNNDMCFNDPVRSVIDNKHYTNRRDYNNHLKLHGCIEVGNDSSIRKPQNVGEVRGDFNVQAQLKDAIQQVCGH